MGTEALRFLLMFFAGWVHRGQLDVIDYLKEENRVQREQLGDRRLLRSLRTGHAGEYPPSPSAPEPINADR